MTSIQSRNCVTSKTMIPALNASETKKRGKLLECCLLIKALPSAPKELSLMNGRCLRLALFIPPATARCQLLACALFVHSGTRVAANAANLSAGCVAAGLLQVLFTCRPRQPGTGKREYLPSRFISCVQWHLLFLGLDCSQYHCSRYRPLVSKGTTADLWCTSFWAWC